MAARSVWKGHVRFSLVTIPVKAFTGTATGGGRIHLNQLHGNLPNDEECGARIRYMKYCPTHGEVPNNEIVSGYQVSKDQYVVIDTAEVDKLRPANERAIGIEAFLDEDAIEPRFYNGKTYYLVPDGMAGKRSYNLLVRLLNEEKKLAFAQGVFQNREQIMALRSRGRLLVANFLSYTDELKHPGEFEGEVPESDVPDKEMEIARTLVAQLTPEKFDLSEYKDRYEERLQKLIEAKVAGQEIVAAPEEEPAPVINLMEALQKSLQEAQAAAKPAKQVAPGTAGKRAAASRKRKSS
jgi:DNA end-binding protein Ku